MVSVQSNEYINGKLSVAKLCVLGFLVKGSAELPYQRLPKALLLTSSEVNNGQVDDCRWTVDIVIIDYLLRIHCRKWKKRWHMEHDLVIFKKACASCPAYVWEPWKSQKFKFAHFKSLKNQICLLGKSQKFKFAHFKSIKKSNLPTWKVKKFKFAELKSQKIHICTLEKSQNLNLHTWKV